MRKPAVVASTLALILVALLTAGTSAQTKPPVACAPPAVPDPMPEGGAHKHADASQHAFACMLESVASLDLKETIPEPMMFGEVDIAGNLAVIATTFPAAGFVTLDVANPRSPRVLGRFLGPKCETETDIDCGADLRLSPDGKTAYLATQRSGRSQRQPSDRTRAGIIVVDLTDPAKPKEIGFTALPTVGVHMLAPHTVAGVQYVWARARGVGPSGPEGRESGVAILRVEKDRSLKRIGGIVTDAAHDVFLYDDPADKTTYLYVLGAQAGSMFIYDVGDVANPKRVGTWTPPKEVPDNEWYMHNAWVFREGNRRLAFVGPELYTKFGSLPGGHGSVAGPLWLVDVTDHAKPTLIGEWRNPGKHKAGNLTLSPHNTWYAGGGITWTAHYHGGVWVLDWNAVFRGESRRPSEIGYHVPNKITREFVTSDAKDKFITAPELLTRPLIWDVVVADRWGFASDINGGFVVLERTIPTPSPSASPSSSASASTGPRADGGRSFPLGLIAALLLLASGLPLLALVRRRHR